MKPEDKRRLKISAAKKKHGHSRCRVTGTLCSGTYTSWSCMIQRCTNPKRDEWELYGGRGIKVYQKWRKFENFLADMGERPDGMTIDRRDPNGNYDPSNCRWIPSSEQSRTTRIYLDVPMCIACGTRRGNRQGRCHRCNEYFRRHGVDRPKGEERVEQKKMPPRRCLNCETVTHRIAKERCMICYNYLLRTKRDRITL